MSGDEPAIILQRLIDAKARSSPRSPATPVALSDVPRRQRRDRTPHATTAAMADRTYPPEPPLRQPEGMNISRVRSTRYCRGLRVVIEARGRKWNRKCPTRGPRSTRS